MTFERSRYLDWYMQRSRRNDGAVNLHASGVQSLALSDVPEAEPPDPWVAPRPCEEALGAWLCVPPAEILYTPGGTGGTLLCILALADPGDRILVESPIYEPLLMQAERVGPVARFRRSREQGWGLPLGEIRRALDRGTRLVLVTEPCNPTGTFSPRDQVIELADMAAGAGALVLVNEVYRRFSDAPSYHGVRENIVVVASLSKLLGPYWARLGWVSARPHVVDRLRSAHLVMSMASSPGASAGMGVLRRADDLRARAMEISARGRAAVDSWVSSTPGISWTPPSGPGFGLVHLPPGLPPGLPSELTPGLRPGCADDVVLAERLHDEHGVLLVPGTFFEVPGSFRLSWIQAGDRLADGLASISTLLERISP